MTLVERAMKVRGQLADPVGLATTSDKALDNIILVRGVDALDGLMHWAPIDQRQGYWVTSHCFTSFALQCTPNCSSWAMTWSIIRRTSTSRVRGSILGAVEVQVRKGVDEQ